MRPATNCPLPFGDLQIDGLQLTLAPLNGELFINCQLSCLDIIYNLLSYLDISTIAYIRPFLLCTNVKHPFCAICAADYIGNVYNLCLSLLSNQPKLLKIVELLGCKWYHC